MNWYTINQKITHAYGQQVTVDEKHGEKQPHKTNR